MSNEKEELIKLIEDKREEMIRLAKENGKVNKGTVTCSQELDFLILKFQKLLCSVPK